MKLVIKIFNLIYLVFAAVAATCFITKPVVNIDGAYLLSTEQITSILPAEIKDQVSEQELKDAFKDADGNEVPLEVPLTFNLDASIVIRFKDKEGIKNYFNTTIENTVSNVVSKLGTPIHNLAVIIAKKTANKTIYDNILQQVQNAQSSTAEEAAAKMEEAGINDEYIANFTDEVYEKLSEEGATFDNVMSVVENKMFDVADKLDITEFDPNTATEQVRNGLESALKNASLLNEDGTINDIDDAITTLLLGFLNGDSLNLGGETINSGKTNEDDSEVVPPEPIIEGEGDETPKEIAYKVLQVRAEGSEEEETKEKEAELTAKITEKLMELVNKANIVDIYAQFSFIPFILLCLLIAPWAILAIVSIIRIIRPKKCWVKTWYVFTFAFEQLILGVVITVLTTKLLPILLPKIADATGVTQIADIASSLNISIMTSSFIPSILYLVMIPLTIIYMILARKVKKQYKAEKAERKAAKKAAKQAAKAA